MQDAAGTKNKLFNTSPDFRNDINNHYNSYDIRQAAETIFKERVIYWILVTILILNIFMVMASIVIMVDLKHISDSIRDVGYQLNYE